MPELGKATYFLVLDSAEFDTGMTRAEQRAAAATKGIGASLGAVQTSAERTASVVMESGTSTATGFQKMGAGAQTAAEEAKAGAAEIGAAAKSAAATVDAASTSTVTAWGKMGSSVKKSSEQTFGTAKLIGLAAVYETIKAGGTFIKEGNAAQLQFNNSLKQTGNVAGTTTKDLIAFANSAESAANGGRTAVFQAQNILLTFRNIRNQAGKGMDIFNRAQQAVLDIHAKTGRGMNTIAIALGKTLQDPIKYMNTLGRAGITFNKTQQDTVKTLIQQGKGTQAQAYIMDQLAQFTGAAEARTKSFAGQMAEARFQLEKSSAQIDKAFIPAFVKFVNILEKVANFMSHHTKLVETLVLGYAGLKIALFGVGVAMKIWEGTKMLSVLLGLAPAAEGAAGGFEALSAAMLANPIGAIALALTGVAIGLVVLYHKWKWFHDQVNALWASLKQTVKDWVAFFEGIFTHPIKMVEQQFDGLKSHLEKMFSLDGGLGATFKRWGESLGGWMFGPAFGWADRLGKAVWNLATGGGGSKTAPAIPGVGLNGFPGGGFIPGGGSAMNTSKGMNYIGRTATKYGLDPRAVLGVATAEGGGGGIGDHGTSFGPFQLHVGGAFPVSMYGLSTAQKQAWAWSPAGINYALSRIAASGARGLKGSAAINAIVRNFERPANPTHDLTTANAYYYGKTYKGKGSKYAPPPDLPMGNVTPKQLGDILGPQWIKLETARALAHRTKTLADDKAALKAEDVFLLGILKNHKMSAQNKLDLINQINAVEDEMKSVGMKGKKKLTGLAAILGPEWVKLDIKLQSALMTKTLADDRRVLKAQVDFLNGVLKNRKLSLADRDKVKKELVKVMNALKQDNKDIMTAAQGSAQELSAMASLRGSFFGEFAPNIFTASPAGLLPGGTMMVAERKQTPTPRGHAGGGVVNHYATGGVVNHYHGASWGSDSHRYHRAARRYFEHHSPAKERRGTDTVPAMLTEGEIILNQRQQRMLRQKMGLPANGSPRQLFSAITGAPPPNGALVLQVGHHSLQASRGGSRAPSRPNIDNWLRQGSGISQAQRDAAADWWDTNWRQVSKGYYTGGIASNDSAPSFSYYKGSYGDRQAHKKHSWFHSFIHDSRQPWNVGKHLTVGAAGAIANAAKGDYAVLTGNQKGIDKANRNLNRSLRRQIAPLILAKREHDKGQNLAALKWLSVFGLGFVGPGRGTGEEMWTAGMSAAEKRAFRSKMSNMSNDAVQSAARNGKIPGRLGNAGMRRKAALIDAVINRAPRTGDAMTVYRGIKDIEREFGTTAEELVGNVFRNRGFLSTTFDPELAEYFAHGIGGKNRSGGVMTLHVPAGSRGVNLKDLGLRAHLAAGTLPEAEFLLPTRTRVRVGGISRGRYGYKLDAALDTASSRTRGGISRRDALLAQIPVHFDPLTHAREVLATGHQLPAHLMNEQALANKFVELHSLAKEGIEYKDFYTRAAIVAKHTARNIGMSVPKVVQLLALFSQQARPTHNFNQFLTQARNHLEGREITPSGITGSIPKSRKGDPTYVPHGVRKANDILAGKTIEEVFGPMYTKTGKMHKSSQKIKRYAANILQDINPVLYKKWFGDQQFSTMDIHATNAIDRSLDGKPGIYYPGFEKIYSELGRAMGMTAKEAQAAVWAPIKAMNDREKVVASGLKPKGTYHAYMSSAGDAYERAYKQHFGDEAFHKLMLEFRRKNLETFGYNFRTRKVEKLGVEHKLNETDSRTPTMRDIRRGERRRKNEGIPDWLRHRERRSGLDRRTQYQDIPGQMSMFDILNFTKKSRSRPKKDSDRIHDMFSFKGPPARRGTATWNAWHWTVPDDYKAMSNEAYDLIHSILSVPTWATKGTKIGNSPLKDWVDANGRLRSRPDYKGTRAGVTGRVPLHMGARMNEPYENQMHTLIHEIGHALDYSVLKPQRNSSLPASHIFAGGSTEHPMTKLMDTIANSVTGQEVLRLANKAGASEFDEYLGRPVEMFARAFAQYITHKTGHPGLKKALESDMNINPILGWGPKKLFERGHTEHKAASDMFDEHLLHEFDPIAAAMDALFMHHGMLKKFATGGLVSGSGKGDTVPAMLTPGEVVFNAKQIKNFAKSMGLPKGLSAKQFFALANSAPLGASLSGGLNLSGLFASAPQFSASVPDNIAVAKLASLLGLDSKQATALTHALAGQHLAMGGVVDNHPEASSPHLSSLREWHQRRISRALGVAQLPNFVSHIKQGETKTLHYEQNNNFHEIPKDRFALARQMRQATEAMVS